jgi:hypothetical protein
LVIGLVAGGVLLILICCGALAAIGANSGKSDPKSAPAASVPTAVPATSAPTTPPVAVIPTTPAMTATPAAPTTPPPVVVAMPNVVGTNAAVADDQLRKLGFTRIQFGSQDKADKVVLLLSNWTVTKQSTKAGEQVSTDTLVVLTCTKEG